MRTEASCARSGAAISPAAAVDLLGSSWTWAAARIGLGRLLTSSVTLSAVALLCCAVAPAYWLVVACAVLFGLSSGAVDAALNAYAARHFGPRRINLMHAAFGIGAATSPLVVTVVVSAGARWRYRQPSPARSCRAIGQPSWSVECCSAQQQNESASGRSSLPRPSSSSSQQSWWSPNSQFP